MIACWKCGALCPVEWPICVRCENDLTKPKPKMSLPQSVTIRYATNLLTAGKNDIFELDRVTQVPNKVAGGDIIGFYFEAHVKSRTDFESKGAAGATPVAAVKSALEKHGVTFQ